MTLITHNVSHHIYFAYITHFFHLRIVYWQENVSWLDHMIVKQRKLGYMIVVSVCMAKKSVKYFNGFLSLKMWNWLIVSKSCSICMYFFTHSPPRSTRFFGPVLHYLFFKMPLPVQLHIKEFRAAWICCLLLLYHFCFYTHCVMWGGCISVSEKTVICMSSCSTNRVGWACLASV